MAKKIIARNLQELQTYMEQEPPKIIGGGLVRHTDSKKDDILSTFEQEKYQLDENGDPIGSDFMIDAAFKGAAHSALVESEEIESGGDISLDADSASVLAGLGISLDN